MIPEYLDKNCMVYQRDAVEFIDMLHAESVQLIWTDPPGLRDQNLSPKTVSQMEAIELCVAVADAAFRTLTPNGVLAICLSNQSADGVGPAVVKRTHMKPGGLIWDSSDLDSVVISFHKGDPWAHKDVADSDTISHFILTHTNPGDIVVDPFCGSGYVMEAAVKANRIAVVNDQDPDAVVATIARYKEHCA